ncbi:hypothetical protein [Enhygromyxa salina]|uniref:Uncharacterized protein n=1 Tax=Enhygromyxa salina TaxID=215803 RepID=A0A2S9YXT3_9BACT|nr:hypothetical protein [Enhygromyxa salina]PRQ09887.1 hypothetical protein ENSA7_03680 [Enhygromyxa salina]
MARADVTGERIQLALADDASGKKFEEFFRRLLEKERELRHVVGTTEIHGPTRYGKGDGGSDGTFVVNDEPRISRREFAEALTWDEPGRTWYTLKNSPNWDKLVKRDVGYGGFIDDPAKSPPKGMKRPRTELLEHICAGGRFVIVVSQQAGDGRSLLDAVSKALMHWLSEADKAVPATLREQLTFKSANELAAFVRAHAPSLPSEFANKLGLTVPDGLQSWTEWTSRLGREQPTYRADDPRRQIIDLIRSSSTPQVIRILRLPGVGKTRLVHHALGQLDLDVIHYTDVVMIGQQVTRSNWIAQDAGAITLVIDEVTSYDAKELTRDFHGKAPAGARMLLIGVSDEDASEGEFDGGQAVSFHLPDLSNAQMRALVETEFGQAPDDEQVQIVLELSEGYPLFAILLVRGLLGDQDLLARGDDQAAHWEAARRVLAGSRAEYGGNERWRREARVRAKCLLVVIMTGHVDVSWNDLWVQHGEALRHAICTPDDASHVQAAHDSCHEREILRRVGRSNRRYVSPANLSRIILNHFFTGPEDLGPRVARHTPEFLERLQVQAKRFQAAPSVRQRLAQCLWDEFERRTPAPDSLDAILDRPRGLDMAAELMPERAAHLTAAAIQSLSSAHLARAKRLRHGLRGVFQTLVQQPISAIAYEQIEDALFRMAKVEDERWANNATGIWKSLALVAVSQTDRPWPARFELLRRRCLHGPPDDRWLALEGLAVAVAHREVGLGHSRDEYEWAQPSLDELRASKRQAWTLLISVCDDQEPSVAARAQEIVGRELRGCINEDACLVDLSLLEALERSVGTWAPEQRKQLSEALADIYRYDADLISAALATAIANLARALAPSNFVESLVHQVGSWHPGPSPIDDEQREAHERATDEIIAREAIANPSALIEQFPWLSSEDAKRRRPFLRALGRLDLARVFVTPLEDNSIDHPHPREWLLPWYIEGWAEADDASQADAWLIAQLSGGGRRRVAALTLPFLEPSEVRLRWLIDLIQRGEAEPAVPAMMYRRWISSDFIALDCELIEAMQSHAGLAPVAVSLANKLLDEPLDPSTRERVSLIAARLLRSTTETHMPSVTEFDWQRLVTKLAEADHVADAVGAVVELASTDAHRNLSLVDRAVRMLIERGHAARLWTGVAPVLAGEQGSSLAWRLTGTGLLAAVDTATVLEWIGGRKQRAVMIAGMQRLYGPALPALSRELLIRFGNGSGVGSTLAARVFSTPRAVPDLTQFKRHQLERARSWGKDEAPGVRRWALDVAADLERSIEEAEAQAEFSRMYG